MEKLTIDGWNRKLTYAISKNLVSAETYGDALGAIDIVDEHDGTVLDKEGTAHMVLISHGENGRGAYSREGQQIDSCSISGAGSLVNETENCDNDGSFLSGLRNDSENSYNDDFTQFLMTKSTALWKRTPSGIANTNAGNVGIGTEEPDQKLHIKGDLQVAEAKSDYYCDPGGFNCMTATSIAGEVPRMFCSSYNQAFVGIENDGKICANVFLNANISCPSEKVMTGISSKTGAICKNLPSK